MNRWFLVLCLGLGGCGSHNESGEESQLQASQTGCAAYWEGFVLDSQNQCQARSTSACSNPFPFTTLHSCLAGRGAAQPEEEVTVTEPEPAVILAPNPCIHARCLPERPPLRPCIGLNCGGREPIR